MSIKDIDTKRVIPNSPAFRLESYELLLKTFNELDDDGKRRALRAMGSKDVFS